MVYTMSMHTTDEDPDRTEIRIGTYVFHVWENPEPDAPSDQYYVRIYDDGEFLESFTTDDPTRDYEAARAA